MRWSRQLVVSGLAVALLLLAHPLPACGPSWWRPEFTSPSGLDWSEAEFASGRLGLLNIGDDPYQQVRDRDDFIAYRVLSGVPFTSAEIRSLLSDPTAQPQPSSWIQQWESLQDLGNADQPAFERGAWGPGVYAPARGYFRLFLNCPEDAFRNAVVTYNDRRRRYATQPQLLAEWLDGQRTVFLNCDLPAPGHAADNNEAGPESGLPTIPAALPADRPALAQADRNYQIASAQFYAEEYEAAASAFLAIAGDKNSPWAPSGRYLAARAFVRQATLQPDVPDASNAGYGPASAAEMDKWLTRAEQQVNAVLADPAESAWQRPARQLSGFIELRLHPNQRGLQLARQLMQPGDPTLRQDEIDLDFLRENPDLSFNIDKENDLLAWMDCFGCGVNYQFERWQATRSLPWLVTALASEPAKPIDQKVVGEERLGRYGLAPKSPAAMLPELLAAAARVPPASPAFEVLRFERLRIATETGKSAEAATELAKLDMHAMPVGLRNEYLALKFRAAQNFRQAVAAAPRNALNEDWMGFDTDALTFYNAFAPLSMWVQTASLETLPPRLQDEVVHAGWTRAALLDDVGSATTLGPMLGKLQPGLGQDLAAYEHAREPAARHFAAAWLLLHVPGMSPFVGERLVFEQKSPAWNTMDDQDQDNWWALRPPEGWYGNAPLYPFWGGGEYAPDFALIPLYPNGFEPPAFLAKPGPTPVSSDYRRIEALGPAPDVLSHWVLDWVQSHREDPRSAEALALAVTAATVGCGGKSTAQLAKSAYDDLQQYYAGSSWAVNTQPPEVPARHDKYSVCW